jgi:hypothetical protein
MFAITGQFDSINLLIDYTLWWFYIPNRIVSWCQWVRMLSVISGLRLEALSLKMICSAVGFCLIWTLLLSRLEGKDHHLRPAMGNAGTHAQNVARRMINCWPATTKSEEGKHMSPLIQLEDNLRERLRLEMLCSSRHAYHVQNFPMNL